MTDLICSYCNKPINPLLINEKSPRKLKHHPGCRGKANHQLRMKRLKGGV